MCGRDFIEGKFMLGLGRLCMLGLMFLTADMALLRSSTDSSLEKKIKKCNKKNEHVFNNYFKIIKFPRAKLVYAYMYICSQAQMLTRSSIND